MAVVSGKSDHFYLIIALRKIRVRSAEAPANTGLVPLLFRETFFRMAYSPEQEP
jgi:hypothetical protein